jgi:UrcA family protein
MTVRVNFRTVLCASTLLALIPLAGFAAEVQVQFADLDIARPADAQVLYSRIAQAAKKVCFDSPDAYFKCVKRSVSDAVAAVNAPQLSKIYAQKSGHLKADVTLASTQAAARLGQ